MLMLSGIEFNFQTYIFMRFYSLVFFRVKQRIRSRQYIYIWQRTRSIRVFFFICGSHLTIILCICWTFFLLFRNFLFREFNDSCLSNRSFKRLFFQTVFQHNFQKPIFMNLFSSFILSLNIRNTY